MTCIIIHGIIMFASYITLTGSISLIVCQYGSAQKGHISRISYCHIVFCQYPIFKHKWNCRRKSMQEKESIMVVWCKLKVPSLRITVRHRSASLAMLNSYHRDRIFNPQLTAIKILIIKKMCNV